MKKFEYLRAVDSTIQELNELGSIGWELVSDNCIVEKYWGTSNGDLEATKKRTYVYTFKREINE